MKYVSKKLKDLRRMKGINERIPPPHDINRENHHRFRHQVASLSRVYLSNPTLGLVT